MGVHFLLLPVVRILTTLIHEFGHAIPAALLTRKKVSVYVGSYGDPAKSFRIQTKWFDIWARYNLLMWRGGLCIPQATDASINVMLVYVICGPIASLLIAGTAFVLVFHNDVHWSVKWFLILFLVSAIIDLLVNLIPQKKAIRLYDGRVSYNDGALLRNLWKSRKTPDNYYAALRLYNTERYDECADMLERLIVRRQGNSNIFGVALSATMLSKDLDRLHRISEQIEAYPDLTAEDVGTIALLKAQMGYHEESLLDFDRSLAMNPDNWNVLGNRGFTLMLIERYDDAIEDFDLALEIQPAQSYLYSNRGLAKIKLGRIEEGLRDLDRSFELNGNEAYAHRNLGMYHLDRGEFFEALVLFEKAKSIDASTHMIDHYVDRATKGIEGIPNQAPE